MTAHQLLAAARKLTRHGADRLKPFGLTWPQYQVLRAVAQHAGAIAVGKAARELEISKTTVTTVADQLERAGWIARERPQTDRRVVILRLTEKGQRIHEIIRQVDPSLDEAAKKLVARNGTYRA